ncbi:hypothetical protein ACFFRR_004180 [Megaselia abdita]
MKAFIILVALSLASSAYGACSQSEVFLSNRNLCAAKCTATSTTCGGGTCQGTTCTCDAGYQNTASGALCVPICVRGCVASGGSCSAPGVCDCKDPTQYYDAATLKCVAKPECGGDCTGKICDVSGCNCAPGYVEEAGKCVPTCGGKCDAAKGQVCVVPGVCSCEDPTKNINDLGVCASVVFVTTAGPTTAAPTTAAPTTAAPTTATPTTEAPTTEAPTTESPTTEVPTTETPITPDVTTPAPACDVCAKLADIEAQQAEILALL